MALFLFLAAPAIAPAEPPAAPTPESLVKLYFDSVKEGDLASLSARMHPAELEKFKSMLLPMIKGAAEDAANPLADPMDVEAMKRFLGGQTIEDIAAESPAAFFTRFMDWIQQLNPVLRLSLSSAKVEPIGSIPEKDMAHVVYRLSLIDALGNRVTQLGVMSVKKLGDEWRLMLTGDMEQMAAMMDRSAAFP